MEPPHQGLVLTVLVPTLLVELLEVFLDSLLPRTSPLPSSSSVVKAIRPQPLLLLETQPCLRLSSLCLGLWTTMNLCRLIPTLLSPRFTMKLRPLQAVSLLAPGGPLR